MSNLGDMYLAEKALQIFLDFIRFMSPDKLRETFGAATAEAIINLRKSAIEDADAKKERLCRKREEKASRIADLIIAVTKDKGECTVDDLLRAGFSKSVIDDLSTLAYGFVATRMPPHKTIN